MMPFSVLLFGQVTLFGIILLILRAIYRVTFHPLACFPGPTLAAVTDLFAASYDLSGNDSLVKHLKDLHDKYGPIVRVRPNELHVFDWEAYRVVFRQLSEFSKPSEFYNAPHVKDSFITTSHFRDAKPHRDLFTTALSKSNVNDLEPLIHAKTEAFFDKLRAAARDDRTVFLSRGLNCLTGDLTMHFCYQMDLGLLNAPNFEAPMIMQMHDSAPVVPFFWYFSTVVKLMDMMIFSWLPDNVVKAVFPSVALMKDMVKQCQDLITSLAKAPHDSEEVRKSIFRQALNPNKEKGQYQATSRELAADAVLMFLAGTDTTGFALCTGIWHMIKNRAIWTQLRREVNDVVPKSGFASVKDIENLPYLRAVTKETLRFSMGSSARMPRLVPPDGATLCGRHVPAGTKISFAHYVYNNDPSIFPNPFVFDPSRWLDTKQRIDFLDAHMISFSRGSRNCIGMNLAYAELYNVFAHMVTRFELINDGTTEEDMNWIDAFTPSLLGELKVKVRIAES